MAKCLFPHRKMKSYQQSSNCDYLQNCKRSLLWGLFIRILLTIVFRTNKQKQPARGVPRKRCSENMQQIYRRTPMSKCDFKNFIETALWHGCSPVNLLHASRTPFLKNVSGLLLLNRAHCRECFFSGSLGCISRAS